MGLFPRTCCHRWSEPRFRSAKAIWIFCLTEGSEDRLPFEGRMSTDAKAKRIELLQGTLDMLILRTLVIGPAHGHQIAKHIQRTTDDLLQIEHGSLYPALHRLERKGWLSAKWEAAAKGQKRGVKYYRSTAAGARQ